MNPGATVVVAVREPPINLRVMNGAQPVQNATVKLTGTGSGCGALPARATGANGYLVDPAYPYGTYTACVQATRRTRAQTDDADRRDDAREHEPDRRRGRRRRDVRHGHGTGGDVPMTGLARIRRRLRDERGFTLVELLVSTSIGVAVLLATFAIFDSALLAQNRVDDRTDSIARGRTGMEQIVQQLRSQVCLGPSLPAIEYGDDDEMRFYADLANTTFVPERRVLTFAGGALTERDYTGSSVRRLAAVHVQRRARAYARDPRPPGADSQGGTPMPVLHLLRLRRQHPAAADESCSRSR